MLRNQDGKLFYFPVTDTNFTGQGNYDLKITHNLTAGKYQIYLCPHLTTKDDLPFYRIAFANDKMYDQTLKANLLDNVVIA